jgi:hypothetical protein
MAKEQAFLSLERSKATTMSAVWSKAAEKVVARVQPLIEAGKYDEAHDIAARLTMNGVVEAQRRRLEELSVTSLLFGASNVTGNVRQTSFATGKQEVPYALQQALDQLTGSVEMGGSALVRNQLHAVIREQELQPIAKDELSLADRLNAAVMGTGKMAIDIGANLTTSRLVSLGFLSEAVDREITTYQVSEVLDERICPVCQFMHGKTFDVGHEYSRLVQALSTQDPKELKSIAPWPSQSRSGMETLRALTPGEMQAHGFGAPPYHPGCRGILVVTGTVTETISSPSAQPLPAEDVAAAPVQADPMEVYARWKELAATIKHTDLTADNVAMVDDYVGNAFNQLNRDLRYGIPDETDEEYASYRKEQIDRMRQVMKNAPKLPKDTTLYRGFYDVKRVLGTDDLPSLVGKTITDKGFMSLSGDIQAASEFGKGGAVIEVKVPAGVKAVVPEAIEKVLTGHESEVILKDGTRLKVTGVDVSVTPPVIHAEVVTRAEKADDDIVMKADRGNRFVWSPGDIQVQ